MQKAFFAILLTAVTAVRLFAIQLLSPQGIPYISIVLEENDTRAAELAAREMQTWLAELSGTQLPIVSSSREAPVIRLGNAAGLASELAGQPADAFVVRTAGNGDLLIAGVDAIAPPDFGFVNPWREIELQNAAIGLSLLESAGTANGVYSFLQEQCGIRFYGIGPDGTDVPALVHDLQLPPLDYQRAPRFTYRYPYLCFLAKDAETAFWLRRVGFGGAAPVLITHAFWVMNQYRETHPEFFALTKEGGRALANENVVTGLGNLCLHNEEMMEAFLAEIEKYFNSHPTSDIYPMGANDGLFEICACPQCQADLDHPHREGTGDFSWHIWGFVNRMAKRLAERCPGKSIGCFSYEKYLDPPEGMSFEPNVVVMLCHARSRLVSAEAAQEFHARVEEWMKFTSRLYCWDWYLTHWPPTHHLPIFYSRTIEREIKYLASLPKFQGEFIESENHPHLHAKPYDRPYQPNVIQPNLYLTAKLQWNPDLDAQALLEEFYGRYYGPAAAPMKAFWQLAENSFESAMANSAKRPGGEAYLPQATPAEIFPPNVLLQLEVLLAKALALAPENSIHHRRIKALQTECSPGFARLRTLSSQETALYEAPRVTAPEGVELSPSQSFVTLDGLPAKPATFFQAAYDRNAIHFRVVCQEPSMDKLVTNAHADGPEPKQPWDDDCIELFIGPNAEDQSTIYHIIITADGFLWDAKALGLLQSDTSWNSRAAIQVRHDEASWRLDLSIPVDVLGIVDPNFSPDLLLQLCRTRQAGGFSESSAWRPTGESAYFQPERFGLLRLAR